MNRKKILAGCLACIVGLVMIIVGAVGLQNRTPSYLDTNYREVSSSTWDCSPQDPIAVGRKLRDDLKPDAYAEDAGRAYLRDGNRLMEVGMKDGKCTIESGDRGSSFGGGHFAYLGPGFGPSSPSSSSGGSSGGYGGSK